MSKRDGKGGRKYPPDPHQYYREPRFAAEQVFDSLDFGGGMIWDPACGSGNILEVARDKGYRTFGSDIVDREERPPRHDFARSEFLKRRELPFAVRPGERLSIFCNPPYGRVGGVANMGERFVRHALAHFAERCYRLAFLVPIEFVAGQSRYWNIYSRRRPSHVLIHCQRPSMPPGAAVAALGDKAFGEGMADYLTIVWTEGGPYRTELVFMRPDDSTRPPDGERRTK
jgi:hypothetical protein